MKKRKLSVILFVPVLLTVQLVLTSCGIIIPRGGSETNDPNAGTDAPSVSDQITIPPETLPNGTHIVPETDSYARAKIYVDSLTDYDLGDVSFLIATEEPVRINPVFDSEESATLTDVALLKRNQLVESKYGVNLLSVAMDAQTMYEKFRNGTKANDYFTDLMEIPAQNINRYIVTSDLFNLRSLPFTDYSQPYFNADAINQTSAGNCTYGVEGAANLYADEAYCVFFNKEIPGMDAKSLYQAAYSGSWTWERLLSAVKALTPADGVNGLLFDARVDDVNRLLLASSGEHLLQSAFGSLPQASEDLSSLESLISTARTVLASSVRGDENSDSAFTGGKTAFYITTASGMARMNETTAVWGILPLPKSEDAQTAYSSCAAYQTVFAVPDVMSSAEMTGLILQAYNAASYGHLTKAYLDSALRDWVRDSDSVSMLGLGIENIVYDFGYLFGASYESVQNASVTAYEKALASDSSFADYYNLAKGTLIRWNPINFPWTS